MTIKKGTLTQFTESETRAAENEAANFDFVAAWKDYRSHLEAGSNSRAEAIAYTWFCAGIALGKKLVLADIKKCR